MLPAAQSLNARADAAYRPAPLFADRGNDRPLHGRSPAAQRARGQVERLIAEAIDDLDLDDAAALLSESRDLKAGIASVRDSLSRAPWVYR